MVPPLAWSESHTFEVIHDTSSFPFSESVKIQALKLTDGIDDAAISVVSAVQGGQVSNSFLSQAML